MNEFASKSIAVLSPDKDYRDTLYCTLSSDAYTVKTYPRGSDFTAEASPTNFDCLIIDAVLKKSGLVARAPLDLAICLGRKMPVVLVAPEHALDLGQLSLPAVTKDIPDLDLLVLIHETIESYRHSH